MESRNQKYVNLSYLALSALVGFVVFTATKHVVAAYDLESRIRQIDLVMRGLSVGLGALVFFILVRSHKSNQFMGEVAGELEKVTWPSQKETVDSTIVVVVMVLVTGLILGLMDYFWTAVIKWILV